MVLADLGAIFIGHELTGDADWSEDGVYLTAPDNAEISLAFMIPQ